MIEYLDKRKGLRKMPRIIISLALLIFIILTWKGCEEWNNLQDYKYGYSDLGQTDPVLKSSHESTKACQGGDECLAGGIIALLSLPFNIAYILIHAVVVIIVKIYLFIGRYVLLIVVAIGFISGLVSISNKET